MNEELHMTIALVTFWIGFVTSLPFLYRVLFQLYRYVRLTYLTRSQAIFIDNSGDEHVVDLRDLIAELQKQKGN